jgi:hypothetical protein
MVKGSFSRRGSSQLQGLSNVFLRTAFYLAGFDFLRHYSTVEFIPGDPRKPSMRTRQLTFEQVLAAEPLGFIPNPAHPGQMLYIVQIQSHAVVAPCEPAGVATWRLITAYRSRKYTKHYLKKSP